MITMSITHTACAGLFAVFAAGQVFAAVRKLPPPSNWNMALAQALIAVLFLRLALGV